VRILKERIPVLAITLLLFTLGVFVQLFAEQIRVDPDSPPRPGDGGPGQGAGGGACTEPCWHFSSTFEGSSIPLTDISVKRGFCCNSFSSKVAVLRTGDGIYKSDDAGKTYQLAQGIRTATYNLAATSDGHMYAATAQGLYKSQDVFKVLGDDLSTWAKVNEQGLPNLPITFVGAIDRNSTEEIYATADAPQSLGGLYKRNSNGTWTRVAENLNVVAISPDCSIGRTFAATKPCPLPCKIGALWVSSGNAGGAGTWSVVPPGTLGAKTTALNDVATHCFFSNDIVMTNADASLPFGEAVMRMPDNLTTWDDVAFVDTTGSGGLAHIRATNVRYENGQTAPAWTPNAGQIYVGALRDLSLLCYPTGSSCSYGLFIGDERSPSWTPLYTDANSPSSVDKWIFAYDASVGWQWVLIEGNWVKYRRTS
jgi:hypothetical protein